MGLVRTFSEQFVGDGVETVPHNGFGWLVRLWTSHAGFVVGIPFTNAVLESLLEGGKYGVAGVGCLMIGLRVAKIVFVFLNNSPEDL